jgi:hypothetical protein
MLSKCNPFRQFFMGREEEVILSKIWQVNGCSRAITDFFNKVSLLESEVLGHYLGTNFIPKFSTGINHTVFTDLQSAIILTAKHYSFILESSTFDFDVRRASRMTNSASSSLSEYYLHHSKTCSPDIVSSPYAHFNISNFLAGLL